MQEYAKLGVYYQVFIDMRRNLDIIEIEPDRFMNFRKLARAGITKEILKSFCNEVFDFAEDKSFFTIHSLKKDGFDSELFEYGFEDFFYASLLISDDRFSWQKMFSTIVFYKGKINLMLKDFVSDIIKRERKIESQFVCVLLVALLVDISAYLFMYKRVRAIRNKIGIKLIFTSLTRC